MSYDFSAVCPSCDSTIKLDHHEVRGGTYELGGSYEAHLNITYNYHDKFGFRDLDGMKVSDSLELLREAVERLGTVEDDDYWKSTDGNAGAACAGLLKIGEWAIERHPAAVWRVT